MKTKTPYELVISEFGGVRECARQIGRDAGSVSNWKKNGGLIPTNIQRKVLERAWELGYNLSAHTLIFGVEE